MELPFLVVEADHAARSRRAREIHDQQRPQSTYAEYSVDATSDSLMIAELFGHRRGHYGCHPSDYRRSDLGYQYTPGLLEIVADGSCFIDNIDQASDDVLDYIEQFVESGTYHRLGATDDVQCTALVILGASSDCERTAAITARLPRRPT